MTGCGQRPDRGSAPSARISEDPSERPRPKPDDPSSSSYASSVVRWNRTTGRSPATEQQTFTWTILFLLVLVFSASADLQKATSRERSSKEEGGESSFATLYTSFRFDRSIIDETLQRFNFLFSGRIICIKNSGARSIIKLACFLTYLARRIRRISSSLRS